jgi:hypothetical protein
MDWFKGGRSWGQLLLAIWLILYGVLYFVHLGIAQEPAILAALALAAGILLLLRR